MNTSYIINNEHGILPVIDDQINLSIGNYTINLPGIYIVTVGAGSTGSQLGFIDPFVWNGERVIVTNNPTSIYKYPISLSGYIPLVGSSSTPYTEIPIGETVEFISDGVNWRTVENKPVAITDIFSNSSAPFYIESPGFYVFKDGTDPYTVLPRASNFNGEQITLFSGYSNLNLLTINTTDLVNEMVDLEGIVSNSWYTFRNAVVTFTSVNGFWRFTEHFEG